MAEAADRDQRDRHIGILGDRHERQRHHQESAGHRAGDHRVDAAAAEPFAVQGGEIAAGDAADIRRQER